MTTLAAARVPTKCYGMDGGEVGRWAVYCGTDYATEVRLIEQLTECARLRHVLLTATTTTTTTTATTTTATTTMQPIPALKTSQEARMH